MNFIITSAAQLSTHFKSLRKAKAWSQSDLGEKLGIGQSRVAQIERDPGAISVDKLVQILQLLDANLVIEPLPARARIVASDAELSGEGGFPQDAGQRQPRAGRILSGRNTNPQNC